MRQVLISIFLVFLSACGGGSGNENSISVVPFTDAQIKETIGWVTLTDSADVSDGRPAKIRRYSEDPALGLVRIRIYLPDATSSSESDYRQKFLNSVAMYNQKFTGYLFLEVFNTPLSIDSNNQGYWRVSYNTSYVPAGGDFQNYCANVSNAPNSGANAYGWEAGDWTFTFNNTLNKNIFWINLNNGHNCNLTQDIVTHEIGHALGLVNGHFNGFGNGPAISENMWAVLYTFYKNPNNMPLDQITIYRN
jgi:hypothetical protein